MLKIKTFHKISALEMGALIRAGEYFTVSSKRERQMALDAARYAGRIITTRPKGSVYEVYFLKTDADGNITQHFPPEPKPPQKRPKPVKMRRVAVAAVNI